MQQVNEKKKFLEIFSNENVDFKKEIIAGITTFLTMAYIIAVNPNILGTEGIGMDKGALVTATCLAAAFASILMGVYANLPFVLASGMGLNAYFAYSVVLGKGISWEVALTAVFVEGIIFILLSLFKVREAVVNAIPINMKHAVTAGIGLFIAFIGLTGSGFVIADDATYLALGNFASPTVLIAFVGLIIIAVLDRKGMKASILVGIVVSTLLSWGYAMMNPEAATALGIYLPNGIFKFESIAPIAGKVDLAYVLHPSNIMNFIVVVCTFLFVDFFDTVGTLVGVSSRAGMLDENGNVPNVGKALMVDAVGTTVGACLGVSTVTTYVESSTGVAAGGRTGWTAITSGVLFLIAMFFSPIFIAIPSCATAPALIYVGYLMLGAVKNIDFGEITEGLPAFMTIAMMPLAYSIGDGLTIGVIAYVLINVLYNIFFAKSGEKKKVSIVMIVLAIVFICKLFFLK
ncbi:MULTISPECIES: NCS2 family permease [Clostridium]|jgi:AGZA family xanthine/uracil permease-like MFS transporter|uniref:Inner membrane protein YicO n=3 Tax=Clostridium butyricum TaxID=1492 RepID=C4IJI4_CLOBU|nr:MULTISPECIES: NCS2 family permease [Clostridium]ETI91307.1 MAG: Inner membrane protein YicO [Clostridium butyricum DORA_1]ALP89950.1 guanine permease [Clostridium butyricum]ALS16402.1 guanine permease [Clostridium butyricum]ANF13566.1 guanine permease [Clostridium butyricum]AOR93633.1 guanine permease [Clostridium butyricum]